MRISGTAGEPASPLAVGQRVCWPDEAVPDRRNLGFRCRSVSHDRRLDRSDAG